MYRRKVSTSRNRNVTPRPLPLREHLRSSANNSASPSLQPPTSMSPSLLPLTPRMTVVNQTNCSVPAVEERPPQPLFHTRITDNANVNSSSQSSEPVSNARMADAANVYLSSRSSEPAVNLPVTDAANVNLGSQSSEKPAAKKRARFQWTTNRIHRILGWLSVASNFEMYTTNTKVNATNKCLEQTGLGGEGCTQQQLKNKLDTLESRYKTVRQTIDQTGWGVDDACNHGDTLIAGQTVTIEEAVKTMFEFYYEMDEIFGTRVNVNPPYVSETGVQSVRTRGNSGADEEYDSEENWSDEDEIDEDPKLIPAGGRQKPVTGPQAASVNKTIAMAEKEKAKREGKGGLDEVEKLAKTSQP